jgi:DNA-binding response OmpR family regulator
MAKILIVEDEKPVSRLITISLSEVGHICSAAFTGNEAVEKIDGDCPDLILLDVMLPEIDGFELLSYIKPLNIPTIMITAKDELGNKIKGLQCGADDYITKPFEIAELIARVDALLRRMGKLQNEVNIDDITVDFVSRKVRRNGEEIALTHKEYELLALMIQNKNIALFRDVMLEKVWGFDYSGCDTRTLDLHIQRLRKKLDWHDKIKTIRKYGYRLEL